MKHLFIVNPVAGGKDRTEEIDARDRGTFCQRDDDYGIYVTKGPMDAARAMVSSLSRAVWRRPMPTPLSASNASASPWRTK